MFIRFPTNGKLLLLMLVVVPANLFGEEVLLEDYQNGGCFAPADWANSFTDGKGNANSVRDAGDFAVVQWASRWSGMPSNGEPRDFSNFKTFQADVKVEPSQPVEVGTNFYFQLLNETDQGYSYWEAFVPQEKVPADGKWYRVHFPLTKMAKGHGDGGDAPKDFSQIIGTVCGMTFDEEDDDQFKAKQACFDNLVLTDDEVSEISVSPVPKAELGKTE